MAIWKKKTPNENITAAEVPAVGSLPSPPSKGDGPPPAPELRKSFRVGETMEVKGELIGKIDVEIAGRVEGRIVLLDHDLRVEDGACVIAEIRVRSVVVRGQVTGDITATERVEIESSGSVLGDITAPAIALATGSRFTGSINQEPVPASRTEVGSGANNPSSGGGARPAAERETKAPARGCSAADRRSNDRPWNEARKRASRPHQPSPSA